MITLSAVSELEVDVITSSSASLDWDAASPTNVYNISYSSDGGNTLVDIAHTGSYINLSGLESSTTYDVEITSTAYGCESEVFSASFTTTVECLTPENISLTATPFNVTSWDAVQNSDSYFVVYYLPTTGWQGVTVTDTFLTLSHESNGIAYFYVRSNCGSGEVSSYSDVSFIELPSCPSISISASVATFCLGESSTLTATGDFDSYQWYNDDGAIDGAVSSTYTATAGGHYYAVGLTTSGCSITSNGVSLNMITLSAVSELEVDNITSSSASLDWDAASPTNVYNISISSDGGLTWTDFGFVCWFGGNFH